MVLGETPPTVGGGYHEIPGRVPPKFGRVPPKIREYPAQIREGPAPTWDEKTPDGR